MLTPFPKILWLTDPWDTLAHDQDTTLRLIQEALKMGFGTYWSSSDFVLNTNDLNSVRVVPLTELHFNPTAEPEPRVEMKLSEFDQIHYRLDPPVDFNYISLLDSLVARSAHQIFSPPSIIKSQSEKLPPAALSHLVPTGYVIRGPDDVRPAFEKLSSMPKVVSKPLNQAQSKGVAAWITPKSFSEWAELISKITSAFQEPLLVQEYLPEVDLGEVRMWFANGQFIAALKKYPKKGDFRVLIDEGSRVEAYTLNAVELENAKAVGKVLKMQNVMLAAIDFIQGKISDYNITSPGLLIQLEKVHGGKNFARMVLDQITRS